MIEITDAALRKAAGEEWILLFRYLPTDIKK